MTFSSVFLYTLILSAAAYHFIDLSQFMLLARYNIVAQKYKDRQTLLTYRVSKIPLDPTVKADVLFETGRPEFVVQYGVS